MNWRLIVAIAACATAGCGHAGDAASPVASGLDRCPAVELDGPLSPETIQRVLKNPPPILNALGRPERLKRALQDGGDPGLCVLGGSLLSLVAMEGDIAAIDLLLDHGARPDLPTDSGGGTPLMIALQRGRFDAARRLIERGADPLRTTDAGLTTLHELAMAETPATPDAGALQLRLARDLVEAGVGVDARHRVQNSTPLLFAVLRNNVPLVAFLLEKGADPSLKDRQGLTPLALARKRRYTEIVNLLETRPSRNTAPSPR